MASGMSTMDAIYWFEAKRAMIDNFALYLSSHRLSDETKAAWRHDNEIKVQAYTVALKALREAQEKEMKVINGIGYWPETGEELPITVNEQEDEFIIEGGKQWNSRGF